MERIYQKIGRIREYLRLIRSIKEDCMERFSNDLLYRGALLHYLYLLTDSCISLGEMAIKRKKLRLPQSYQEVFDILGEAGVLQPDFAFEFAKVAGLRNLLSHDYEKIDVRTICEQVLSRLDEIDVYARQIEDALGISSNS